MNTAKNIGFSMGKACKLGQMELCTMVCGMKVKWMAMVLLIMKIKICIRENSLKTKQTDTEHTHRKMVKYTKASGSKINRMEKEFKK